MSTDIVSTELRMLQLRNRLEAAEARADQAERAQADAEAQARRAEERATKADDDADGWRAFTVALVGEYIVDTRITGASTRLVESVTDSLYQEWSTGRPAIDDLSLAEVVFGAEEETA